jgi:hypothetical protein
MGNFLINDFGYSILSKNLSEPPPPNPEPYPTPEPVPEPSPEPNLEPEPYQ